MQSLIAEFEIRILHGNYYLCNKSWYHATETSNNTVSRRFTHTVRKLHPSSIFVRIKFNSRWRGLHKVLAISLTDDELNVLLWVHFCSVSQYTNFPGLIRHKNFYIAPSTHHRISCLWYRQRVAQVINLIQETSLKDVYPWPSGQHSHWCMAIDNLENSQTIMPFVTCCIVL